MGRGGKFASNLTNKRVERKGSDESDEDFVLGDEEEEEELNDSDGSLVASVEFESDEGMFDSDEEVVKKKKRSKSTSRSKSKGGRRLKRSKPRMGSVGRKRSRVRRPIKRRLGSGSGSDEEDEDYDYEFDVEEEEDDEEEEEEEETERRKKKGGRRVKSWKPKMGIVDKKETRVRRSVKRARVSDEEEEYDFDAEEDDDEEDDEEFAPDEIDCLDDEEELEVKKSSCKMRRSVPVKKGSGRSKKKYKVVKKPVKKKPRRTVVTELSSDDNFDDDYRAAPKRRIQKSSQKRNKRLVVDWDSDYVSSEPSDHEFMLSDEEKLLLKEADRFCGNMEARNSPLSKRLQIKDVPNRQQLRPMGRKGKEKVIVELPNDSGKQVCGICFTEEGKSSVRGTLDCCSHYFCFACIVEWSKIESRCPLCKQRFVSISKPARSNVGIELRNTMLQVPKRDQVYQPSEEEVRGYLDPYENVICMECQQGGDDSLMLLCDLCDSAAHTYCVGLGREVPEGNWYCKGCWTSNPGASNSQVQDSISSGMPAHMHNREVADRTSHLSISVPDSPMPHGFQIPPSPRYPHGFQIPASPRYPGGEDVHVLSPSGVGVSTLSGRRRIHRQIRNMLSNNRMSPLAESAGRDDGFSHGSVKSEAVDDEVVEVREMAVRHGSHSASVEPWIPDFSSHLVRERDPISARLSNLGRLSIATTNGSASETTRAGLERTNSRLSSEQLHRCSRSSFNLSEDSSSHGQMEGTPVSLEKIHSNNKWTS